MSIVRHWRSVIVARSSELFDIATFNISILFIHLFPAQFFIQSERIIEARDAVVWFRVLDEFARVRQDSFLLSIPGWWALANFFGISHLRDDLCCCSIVGWSPSNHMLWIHSYQQLCIKPTTLSLTLLTAACTSTSWFRFYRIPFTFYRKLVYWPSA